MAKQKSAKSSSRGYENLVAAAGKYTEADALDSSVYLNLLHVADLLKAGAQDGLDDHGLGHARFILLLLLNEVESEQPSILADNSGLARATVSGLLDGLEREGLINRKSSKEDRRVVTVRITASGKRLVQKVAPGYFSGVKGLLKDLNQKEKSQIKQLLAKLIASL